MLTKPEFTRSLGRHCFMWEVPDETAESVTRDLAQVTAQWRAAVCTLMKLRAVLGKGIC